MIAVNERLSTTYAVPPNILEKNIANALLHIISSVDEIFMLETFDLWK